MVEPFLMETAEMKHRKTNRKISAPFSIRTLCSLLALSFTGPSTMAAEAQGDSTPVRFPAEINGFLTRHCLSCHGPDKQKGKFRIDTLQQNLVTGPHADDWHEVLEALNTGEMPPEDEPQPEQTELDGVIEFLTAAFDEAAVQRRSTGGQVMMRRLTNYEYNNTLNDLLALDEDFSKDFPPDSVSAEGFRNNGYYMSMSPLQMENYVDAATLAVETAIYEGVQPEPRTLDAMNLESVKGGDGKQMTVRHSDRRGTLLWADPPTQGPVLVEVVGERCQGLQANRSSSHADGWSGHRLQQTQQGTPALGERGRGRTCRHQGGRARSLSVCDTGDPGLSSDSANSSNSLFLAPLQRSARFS